jgi:hypothetical protein
VERAPARTARLGPRAADAVDGRRLPAHDPPVAAGRAAAGSGLRVVSPVC